jgi:hypothetical protein
MSDPHRTCGILTHKMGCDCDLKSKTSFQRARKIKDWIRERLLNTEYIEYPSDNQDFIKFIAAEIEAAEREALNKDHPCHGTGYAEGFRSGVEKAAKVAKKYHDECLQDGCGLNIAEQIRKLKP